MNRPLRPSSSTCSTLSILALATILFSAPAFAQLPCAATEAERVGSDKAHYALGETAEISGSGFSPSCTVQVRMTLPDRSVTMSEPIVTSAAGRFDYSYAIDGPAGRFYNFDVMGEHQLTGDLFSAGAVLWTDKGDYHPGENVQISGLGWQPGETVRLDLHENNGPHADLEFSATADASGAIVNTDFTPDASHRDINFKITGTGLESGRTAFNYFNDAGAFVKVIGTNTLNSVTNNSITVTVPAGGVAAGNSIIVSLSVGSFAGAIGCSDPDNGAYTTDLTSPDSGAARIAIVSRHNVAALASGDVITCTYPQFSGISLVSALEFSGLSATPFDTSAAASSTNAGSASSGLTATTAQSDELVLGVVRVGVAPVQGFTAGTSGGNPVENPYNPPYTGTGEVWHSGNTAGLEPWYRFVTSSRQYEMNGTVTGSGGWRIAVATYKVGATCTSTDTTCDGLDDDCSGEADEDYVAVTNDCGVGVCSASGTPSSCIAGVETPAGPCTPGSPTGPDTTCDGLDDDCSGEADEDYVAVTNDCGTGVCSASGTPSSCIGGVETAAGPCTPGSPSGIPETTCNGDDDDCDGSTDEDYEVDTNDCGTGVCSASGTPSSCISGVETAAGPCTPGSPSGIPESTCNGDDDDCDGSTDEDYVVDTNNCGVGVCSASGTPSSCIGGVETPAGPCTPGSQSGPDTTCDGLDDDCSGEADEDYVPDTNDCGAGVCSASGTPSSCTGGVETPAGPCTPGSPSGIPESTCNGDDDDCDGSTDEDYLVDTNDCGVGVCSASGTPSSCVGGVETPAGPCTPGSPSGIPETTCNGDDDDCDGSTDEDYQPETNDCGVGACSASGTPSSCTGGVETPAGPCTPGTPTGETCDGADNDCDGSTDENATDDGPLTQSCYTGPGGTEGVGICQGGDQTCAGGSYGACVGEVTPAVEICANGIDEDCDGSDTISADEAAIVTPGPLQNILTGSVANVTFCAVLEDAAAGGPLDDITAVTSVHVLVNGIGGNFTAFDGDVATFDDNGDWMACATFALPPVDVYDVVFTILGCDYIGTGSTILVVYDPAAGFTTGGGTIDLGGGKTAIFGVTAKLNKKGKVQGSLLYIERDAFGIENRVKSNAMQGLSIFDSGNPPWVAVVTGKATLNDVGNFSFVVTLKDWGEPGTSDEFALVVKNSSSVTVINVPLTTISAGNIQVPHRRGKK